MESMSNTLDIGPTHALVPAAGTLVASYNHKLLRLHIATRRGQDLRSIAERNAHGTTGIGHSGKSDSDNCRVRRTLDDTLDLASLKRRIWRFQDRDEILWTIGASFT